MLSKNLKMDFGRAIKSWRFLLAVLLMFLIWQINSKRFQIEGDMVYIYVTVWGRSITALLALVVAAVVYVSSFCEDLENLFLRYHILRTGVKNYVISKIIVCFCASFLVMILGSFLFLIWKSASLPLLIPETISALGGTGGTIYGGLLPDHVVLFLGLQMLLHGMLCGGMSALALGLSVFVRHSMGIYVIPFLLDYFLLEIFGKLSVACPWLSLDSIYNFSMSGSRNTLLQMAYAIFATALFVILSYGIMYKKLEGEFR